MVSQSNAYAARQLLPIVIYTTIYAIQYEGPLHYTLFIQVHKQEGIPFPMNTFK